MPQTECPSRPQLDSFQAGVLDEPLLASLGSHVESCSTCQQVLETVVGECADPVLAALLSEPEISPFAAESACREAVQRATALTSAQAGAEITLASAHVSNRGGSESAAGDLPIESIREYKLLAKLGEGGMGAVYKALHTRLDKVVALKILPADRMRDAGSVARFQREMKAVGRLDHPNIVRAMDAGEEGGMHFLVMEYVEGLDLSQLARNIGPLPIADACELIRQAALGLAEAHEHGMVHRDIKPSNLILARPRKKKSAKPAARDAAKPAASDTAPTVKILDLGLALLSEALSPDHQGLTTSGQMMGTIDYMAPEQGGDSHQVDIRADIYSLGATLYKLLTGAAPFAGDKFDTPVKKLTALATQSPASIKARRPDIPARLAAIVERMLAKNPDQRFATPEELVEALAPLCENADLAALLARANAPPSTPAPSASEIGTHAHLSSPSGDTAPTIDRAAAVVNRRAHAAQSGRKVPRSLTIAACIGAALAILLGIIFYIQTQRGTIQIEINDPAIQVVLDNDGSATFQGVDKKHEIKVKPGTHGLTITRGDFSFHTTQFDLKRKEVVVLSIKYLPGKIQVTDAMGKVRDERPLPAYALQFDGVDDYVELPTLKFDPADAFTMELWAEVENLQESPQFLHYSGVPGRRAKIQIGLPLGPDRPNLMSGVTANPPQQATENPEYAGLRFDENFTGGMQHVALCWSPDGSTSLYWNGRRCRNPIFPDRSKRWPTGTSSMIGANPRSDGTKHQFLKGAVRQVRFSKGVRYASDFSPDAEWKPDANTLALYRFEEGSGDVLYDTSGNDHHGKIVGAKWVEAEAPRPQFALAFDGDGQYVEVPGFPYDADGPLTFEAIVQVDELRLAPFVALRGSGRNFSLFRGGDSESSYGFAVQHPQEKDDWFAKAPEKAGWRHVCGVWDGKSSALYVDGQKIGTLHKSGQVFKGKRNAPHLVIGGEIGLPKSLRGRIRGVRISAAARYTADFEPPQSFQRDQQTTALFDFTEGQGEVLKDSSGNVHHGKIVGAKWVKADGSPAQSAAGWQGWPPDAPPPAIAPFDAAAAQAHQRAWATYLGLPVEYTNSIGMKFVLIPPGEFTMGSTRAEIDAALAVLEPGDEIRKELIHSEFPAHRVVLTKPIYLGVHEVTQGQYQQVMGKNPSYYAPTSRGKDAVQGVDTVNYPVDTVSWNDALAFCSELSASEKLQPSAVGNATISDGTPDERYRLPTEAQWEFACRAGTTTRYWTGHSAESLLTTDWTAANAGGRTHAVGELKSNPLGLCDMHGNIWEWVLDRWDTTFYSQFAEKPAIDPSGSSLGSTRVVRGGLWSNPASNARATTRAALLPTTRGGYRLGFRVALPVDAVRKAAKSTGRPDAASAPGQVVDLLKLVDANRDAVHGKWTLSPDGLASDGSVPFCRLKLRYAPPPECDFRVEFTAVGGNDILQLFSVGGRNCTWLMGAWGGKYDGFDTVKNHPLTREGTNIIGGPTSIRRGQRHTSVIQVRRDSITAIIDGKEVVRHATDGSDLGIPSEWSIGEGAIGLGTTFDAVVFHKVELIVPGAAGDRSDEASVRPGPTDVPPALERQEPFTNSLGMKFVLIPKGESWLGGGGGTPGEKHVEFSEDFFLGSFEVTQAEWLAVTGLNPSQFRGVEGLTDEQALRLPVEKVSWDDAQLFLQRLNARDKQPGWIYRLPTEEEWEYACRGSPRSDMLDSGFHYYLEQPTNEPPVGQINYSYPESIQRTNLVGSYPANPLGLFDMHGNVWEWCLDEAPPDPTDETPGPRHAMRGGSWNSNADSCQAAHSYGRPASFRGMHVGLRLARVRATQTDPMPPPTPANE